MKVWVGRVLRWFTQGPFHRWPWLLPLLSFAGGWLGFALVQRGETMARSIAVMALIGWPWLLAESLLGGLLARWSRGALSPSLLTFVTQGLQQEILFFALPFLIGASQRDAGQFAFTAVVALGAFVSTIDPLYHSRIAAQPAVSVAFHAFCTFIASLVVLPMAASMPLEQALPVAIAVSGASLLLSLPRTIRGMRDGRSGMVAIVALLGALFVVWKFPGNVPPAGLSLTHSRITQTLVELQPGAAIRRIDAPIAAESRSHCVCGDSCAGGVVAVRQFRVVVSRRAHGSRPRRDSRRQSSAAGARSLASRISRPIRAGAGGWMCSLRKGN